MFETLLKKIDSKELKVGVVGLGYVGLPLVMEFARSGFEVLGVDVAKEKIDELHKGSSYILDVPSSDVKKYINDKKTVKVALEYSIFKDADSISITVPTPLRKTKDPDVSYILSAMDALLPILKDKKPRLIVLESTTYPGTTRELIAEKLEEAGLKVGQDVFVAFSPERVDPGNKIYNTKNTPKIMGGISDHCTELATKLYAKVIDTVYAVKSTEEAEMVKLLENTFRAVNIALVNELLLMCDRMNINVWRVIDAAKTKPFGFMAFYPGPGIGGHCIPLDPVYLSWKAKTFDFYNRFIELASDINGNMPRFTVQSLSHAMNEKEKAVKGSKVLLLGMAYKKDIDDVRESPGLEIYKILRQEYKADVIYHDPYVDSFRYNDEVIESKNLDDDLLKTSDCVMLLIDHSRFDYEYIEKHSSLILDTRNAFKFDSPKVIKL